MAAIEADPADRRPSPGYHCASKTGAVCLRLNSSRALSIQDEESGLGKLTFPAGNALFASIGGLAVASLGNRRNPEIGNKGSARRRHRLRSLYADEGMRLIAVTGRPGHSDARKGPNISHEILGAQ